MNLGFQVLPFGETLVDENLNSYNSPFKYNGKELDAETGNYYYGARYYDPKWSIFISVDPLAELALNWTPYRYGFNNPVRYMDPSGMYENDDVIITGNKAKEAFNQLNASTSLKLKMDDNAKVTASGKAKTVADKTLLEAVNSTSVEVNINATSSNFTDEGNWYVGGAFGGSTIDENGKVITNQTVNREMTQKIEEFYGAATGVSVLHEILESYIGGKDSPGIGAPTFEEVQKKTRNGMGYLNAHNKAEALDPRHVAANLISDDTGIYISKFPYNVNIPKSINPEILINNLKK